MATIDKTENGKWRVQIRRRGLSKSKTFARKGDASAWAREVERKIDLGQTVSKSGPKHLRTIGDLIDAHIADMHEVGKPLRRSKAYSLDLLRRRPCDPWYRHLMLANHPRPCGCGPGR